MSITFNIISSNPIRRIYIEKLLKSNNIKFKIWSFKPHKSPAFGLFINTIKLYLYARKHKLPYIAILEDNIRIHESYTSNMFQDVESFINTSNWNQLFIGGGINLHGNKIDTIPNSSVYKNRIYKTYTNHGTAAYIIKSNHYNAILKDPKVVDIIKNYKKMGTVIPIDILLQSYPNRYVHKPFIFPRSNVIKSTINGHLDLFRLIYFHPIVFRICEEFLFLNIPICLVGIVILIPILVIIGLILHIKN